MGVEYFPGGPTFYRGSNCFLPIEIHITCDFPGGKTPSGSPHVIQRIVVLSIYSFFLFFFNITFANLFVERGGNVAPAAVMPVVVVIKY